MDAFKRLKRGSLRAVPSCMRERCHATKRENRTVRRCKLRAGHERTIFNSGTDQQFE